MRFAVRAMVGICFAAYLCPANANIFSLLEKAATVAGESTLRSGEKAASRTAELAARAGSFAGRANASLIVAGAAAGAIYIERNGDELLTFALKFGQTPTISLSDPDWIGKLAGTAASRPSEQTAIPKLVFELGTAKQLDAYLPQLEAKADLWVATEYGHPLRLRLDPRAGELLELRPGLVTPLAEAPLPSQIEWLLRQRVQKESLEFVAAFDGDDADALGRFSSAAGEKLKTFGDLIDKTGKLSFERYREKLIVVIGHVEDNGFAIRGSNNQLITTLGFDSVADEAMRNRSSVLFIGCGTYTGGAKNGLLAPISDVAVGKIIEQSLGANAYGDLLARLGSPADPFVLTRDSLSATAESMHIRLQRLNHGSGTVRSGAVVLRLASFTEIAEQGLATSLVAYLVAWIVSAMLNALDPERPLRRSFNRVFPILPSPLLRPRLHKTLVILKELLYFSLMPVVMCAFWFLIILSAFSFSFSAWKERDGVIEGLWTLVLLPHMVLME
jgi:hypothetical protein